MNRGDLCVFFYKREKLKFGDILLVLVLGVALGFILGIIALRGHKVYFDHMLIE